MLGVPLSARLCIVVLLLLMAISGAAVDAPDLLKFTRRFQLPRCRKVLQTSETMLSMEEVEALVAEIREVQQLEAKQQGLRVAIRADRVKTSGGDNSPADEGKDEETRAAEAALAAGRRRDAADLSKLLRSSGRALESKAAAMLRRSAAAAAASSSSSSSSGSGERKPRERPVERAPGDGETGSADGDETGGRSGRSGRPSTGRRQRPTREEWLLDRCAALGVSVERQTELQAALQRSKEIEYELRSHDRRERAATAAAAAPESSSSSEVPAEDAPPAPAAEDVAALRAELNNIRKMINDELGTGAKGGGSSKEEL